MERFGGLNGKVDREEGVWLVWDSYVCGLMDGWGHAEASDVLMTVCSDDHGLKEKYG